MTKNYISHINIYLIYYYHVCVCVFTHMCTWAYGGGVGGWVDGCVHALGHVCALT